MENELMHWGVQGMHWGERRYQNPDGSLTPAGRIHYGVGKARDAGKTVGKAVGKAAVETGKVVGKAAVATGKAVGKEAVTVGRNVVYKHMPKVFMSDEQLARANARVNMERMMLSNKKDIAKMHRGRQVLLGILEDGAKALSKRGFEKLGDAIFDNGAPRGSMEWIGQNKGKANPDELAKWNRNKYILEDSETDKPMNSNESKNTKVLKNENKSADIDKSKKVNTTQTKEKSQKLPKYSGATSMNGTFRDTNAYSAGKTYTDEWLEWSKRFYM